MGYIYCEEFDSVRGMEGLGAACGHCPHGGAEHLVALGALRLCLEDGCACGRKSLVQLVWGFLPWVPTAGAFVYLAWHLRIWSELGFRVVG